MAGERCAADEGVGIGVGKHPEQEPPPSGARARCLCGQTTGAQLLSADQAIPRNARALTKASIMAFNQA